MTKYVLAPSLALLLFSCQQTEEKINNISLTLKMMQSLTKGMQIINRVLKKSARKS